MRKVFAVRASALASLGVWTLFVGFPSFFAAGGEQPVQNLKRFLLSVPGTLFQTLTIAAVGDVMIGSTFPADYALPPNDGKDAIFKVKLALDGRVLSGQLVPGRQNKPGGPAPDPSGHQISSEALDRGL